MPVFAGDAACTPGVPGLRWNLAPSRGSFPRRNTRSQRTGSPDRRRRPRPIQQWMRDALLFSWGPPPNPTRSMPLHTNSTPCCSSGVFSGINSARLKRRRSSRKSVGSERTSATGTRFHWPRSSENPRRWRSTPTATGTISSWRPSRIGRIGSRRQESRCCSRRFSTKKSTTRRTTPTRSPTMNPTDPTRFCFWSRRKTFSTPNSWMQS